MCVHTKHTIPDSVGTGLTTAGSVRPAAAHCDSGRCLPNTHATCRTLSTCMLTHQFSNHLGALGPEHAVGLR